MRMFIRIVIVLVQVVIAVVAGFFLITPLGYVYDALRLPTFQTYGLLHGSFLSAWPVLSTLSFLALGYVPPFRRIDDTPLLIADLLWGLILASFFYHRSYIGAATTYGLLGATVVVVAMSCFFAKHRLRLVMVVMLPIVFLNEDLLLSPPRTFDQWSLAAYRLRDFLEPLGASLGGYVLGSLARVAIRRSPTSA